MEPKKNNSKYLPMGFLDKYQDEIKQLKTMSESMKFLYLKVGREQSDILFREINGLTNREIHTDYLLS